MGKSICFVTDLFEGLDNDGGRGQYFEAMARLLSSNGWEAAVLYLPANGLDIGAFAENYRRNHGIPIYDAYRLCEESGQDIPELLRDCNFYHGRSHIVHEALQALSAAYGHTFDVIEFADAGAMAFIPVSMKRNLGYYGDSRITVKLHGPSQWRDAVMIKAGCTRDDLLNRHMEKYAFENADIQASTSDELLSWCSRHGWQVRKDASVCHDPALAWYDRRSSVALPHPADEATGAPDITVIVPTRNTTTSKYLDLTLAFLKAQSFTGLQIIVNDSSTEPEAVKALEGLMEKHADIRFIHGENGGIGDALNRALPYVSTKYVMEVDGDNLPKPHMVETFVSCMERRKDLAALSCYEAMFHDTDEPSIINNGVDFKPRRYSKPAGTCMPLMLLENTQGDANSVFRTDIVKSIGGWPDEKRKGFQDWSMWLKLLAYGYKVDVIPSVLLYYRLHSDNYHYTKKITDADEINEEYIRRIIQSRPTFFYENCWEGLVQLSRYVPPPRIVETPENSHELTTIKNSALYNLGVRFGRLSQRSFLAKKIFETSGSLIKKALGDPASK